jgi:flagellar biosynthesis protein FlhF
MQVQRFRKPTVREALADVRQALGPDALVVSTLMVPARGWRRLTGHREVEVTATPGARLSETRPDAPAFRQIEVEDRKVARRVSADSGTGDTGESGVAGEVVARLVAAGLDRMLATEVAAALPPDMRRDVSAHRLTDALSSRLAPLAVGPEPLAGIDVFVGPPGAGKTTTIAKLAAQARAAKGLRPTLVAADGYRVGAVEQLRLYADILGLPFLVARTAADLERAIAMGDRPMLVDTAGRSPADRGIRDLFDALSGRPGVRTHLVMAAGTSARDAARIVALYAAASPGRVVLTKVDETESISPVVSVIRAHRLPVSWIGCGQRVPEDLHAADGRRLAVVMLGEHAWAGSRRPVDQSEELCA